MKAFLIIVNLFIGSVLSFSQSYQLFAIKEYFDDLENDRINANIYDPLNSCTQAKKLETMSHFMKAYIRMYQTTKDKTYLFKFIAHAIHIQALRGTLRYL